MRIESNKIFNNELFDIIKNFNCKLTQPNQHNSFMYANIDLTINQLQQISFYYYLFLFF